MALALPLSALAVYTVSALPPFVLVVYTALALLPFALAVYTALALPPFAQVVYTASIAFLLVADTPPQALDNSAVLHDSPAELVSSQKTIFSQQVAFSPAVVFAAFPVVLQDWSAAFQMHVKLAVFSVAAVVPPLRQQLLQLLPPLPLQLPPEPLARFPARSVLA